MTRLCPPFATAFPAARLLGTARKAAVIAMLTVLLGPWSAAQGFIQTPLQWSVPLGGAWDGSTNVGYEYTTNPHRVGGGAHNEYWSTQDLNGDGYLDLLSTLTDSGAVGCYGLPNHPHWRVFLGSPTGFNRQYLQWTLPQGGVVSFSGDPWGYTYPYNLDYVPSSPVGNQTWTTRDMDGDSLPDLLVTGERIDADHYYKVFGLGATRHWKMYRNTGSGFDTVPVQWTLPVGGPVFNGIEVGYYQAEEAYAYNSNTQDKQAWTLEDMNGDGREDLVITAQNNLPDTKLLPFGGANPYWKVFLNNGQGFNTTPTQWQLPPGGNTQNGNFYGFHRMLNDWLSVSEADDVAWEVRDLNGDLRPDLVLTAHEDQSGYTTVFGYPNTPQWQVHLNNGNGFNTASTSWALPDGGSVQDGNHLGFFQLKFDLAEIFELGSQNWDLIDMDGDADLDLVVQSEAQNGYYGIYNALATPFWKVYWNTTAGFSGNPVVWPVPRSGAISQFGPLGCMFTTMLVGSNVDDGSQNYDVRDVNGDHRPDLVVTGTKQNGMNYATVWDPANLPYWQVHLNTAAPVAIPEPTAAPVIDVFPNPASDQLHINAGNSMGKLRILNLHGQLLHAADVQRNQTLSLPVAGYPRGTYFVEFIHGKGAITRKIVLQ